MSQPRILSVDDDPAQLSSMRRLLRRSQFDVETARNGREGLRKTLSFKPDLILLDVAMPCMSGHEFLRRLRRLERRLLGGRDYTPVIFVSAGGRLHQRVDGLDAGAIDYIVKPYDPEELRARVRCALREARRQSERRESMPVDQFTPTSVLDGIKLALAACRQTLVDLEPGAPVRDVKGATPPQLRSNVLVAHAWLRWAVRELERDEAIA